MTQYRPTLFPRITIHVKTRARLSVSLSDQLIQEIDRRRGLAKRSTFVEHLIRIGLDTVTEREAHMKPY